MKDIGLDHDSRFISNSLIIQLLDSFSLQRTQYNLRLRKAREIAQKPITEMEEITIEDYKIYFSDGTQTHVDTTLTINKDYHFNYLRKDYFELLPFANVGETFNKLGYDFQDQKLIPDIGARAKHYGYIEEDEVGYYEVPSPLTEIFFKTVFEQGQLLDALITVNTSPRLNITLAHKAFRSLGNYINTLEVELISALPPSIPQRITVIVSDLTLQLNVLKIKLMVGWIHSVYIFLKKQLTN